jgi:hypothetical protein
MAGQNIYFRKDLHNSLGNESRLKNKSISQIVADRIAFAYSFDDLYQAYIKRVYSAKEGLIDSEDQKILINSMLKNKEAVI